MLFTTSRWFLLQQALIYKRTVVDICEGQYKTDIARRLLCPGAFPKFSEDKATLCGKPTCYGDCKEDLMCGKCKNLDNVYRDQILENEAWPEDTKITFSSYYADPEGTGKEESDLYEHVVHPTKFMKYFNFMSRLYCYHIAKVTRQKNAHKMLEQNLLPNQLEVDMDFSQNFPMNQTRDETQGGNWSTIGCTLFVSVIRFICKTTWAVQPQFLSEGQPVSVLFDNDDSGPLYRYGEIKDNWTLGDIDNVNVWHPALGRVISYPVEKIRIRKIITVPHIVVSDYKGHDSLFVKTYLDKELLGPEGWLQTQTEFPGLAGTITELLICSDGAPSHFKQKVTLHYLTELRLKYKFRRISWTFGAPGHGKGTWDGLGGICKKTMSREIISKCLIMKTAYQVFELLKRLLDSDIKHEEYDRTSRIKIKRWKIVFLSDETVKGVNSVNVEDVEDIKAFDVGSNKIFFFEGFHRDGFGYQLSACWCHACIRGKRVSTFGGIQGCLADEPFDYKICKRKDTIWIAENTILKNNLARGIYHNLKIGQFIAYDIGAKKTPRRKCRFDIGRVEEIEYPSNIKIITFQSTPLSNTDFNFVVKKDSLIIDKDSVRYRFEINPTIANNKNIELSDEIFGNIICNFYNGK